MGFGVQGLKKINKLIQQNSGIFFLIFAFILICVYSSNVNCKDTIKNPRRNDIQMDYAMQEPMIMESAPVSRGNSLAKSSYTRSRSSSNGRKIIRKSYLEVEVKNISSAKIKLEKKVKEAKGKIERLDTYQIYKDQLAYNYTLRIPKEKLDSTITFFKKMGKIKNENFSTYDITDDYKDTENQIKNLLARRDGLRELMKKKTENLSDVLAVDRELNKVQTQIENLMRRQKYRNKDVNLSELRITLMPKQKIQKIEDVKWNFGNSWTLAMNKMIIFSQKSVDFIFTLVAFIPYLLPFVLAGLVIYKKSSLKTKDNK